MMTENMKTTRNEKRPFPSPRSTFGEARPASVLISCEKEGGNLLEMRREKINFGRCAKPTLNLISLTTKRTLQRIMNKV